VRSGIYKIINMVNGKFYIGSAVNFQRRFYIHKNQLNLQKHRNSKLQRAWNKYGGAAFEFVAVEEVLNREQLIATEQSWLDLLRPDLNGYNICKVATSRLGVKASEETKSRMRNAQLGKRPSPETRAKMSQNNKGSKRSPRSPEHRAKISLIHSGKTVSQETRAKLREARKTYKPTAETLKKMSESMKKTLAAKRERQANSLETL
jgi:group I intron endonuclease